MCNAVLKAMTRRVVCWVIGATLKGTLVLESPKHFHGTPTD
jgi:hypothetical protein